MTSVILTDDHPVVRAGLRALLDASGIDVLDEAGSGEEALRVLDRLAEQGVRPDVVLMDLQMGPGLDGVAATRAIRARDDAPRVLILTTYDTDADIVRGVEAGASGYLLKDAPPADLVEAVHRASRGETVLAPAVAARLVNRLSSPAPTLTARELDVLDAVAGGATNKEIAKHLFVSEATVKTHLVHINEKLGATSRTEAVALARRAGLLR
ncbi:response regulator transcription factor [Dermacoccus nishinomiyaensis]|uniref:response regulator n=1 Tax=Dermacoccus TaxID=57495 RepID=UPI00093B400E|nr:MULTISPECIES: response regulator transcription factor [Dermacoccus]MBO1757433.1 response regulator transcription factor [Dermacoccus sp. NHGro5]MCI0153389.1 response regulator transcription factor [Dermacoccus nishinomiyaensis]TJZ95014.1 response regulator transcription factor [Dermacoccus nishinomiyaensis]